MIATLYVQTNGVYYGLPDVDPWDETRDARLYAGPWPVVAHPPCARWSRLAGFTEHRFGLKRGDDGGCFAAALNAVRRFGGVLEHPAYSKAWDKFGLPEPLWREGWTGGTCGGWSCYVEQGRYGLPVKKATWLYAYGCALPELRWGYTTDSEGDDVGGIDAWRDRWGGRQAQWEEARGSDVNAAGVRCRPSHLGQSSTTPPAFRDALLEMARSALPSFDIPSTCYDAWGNWCSEHSAYEALPADEPQVAGRNAASVEPLHPEERGLLGAIESPTAGIAQAVSETDFVVSVHDE